MYAVIQNNAVHDILHVDDVNGILHPSIPVIKIDPADGVKVGWILRNGRLLDPTDLEFTLPKIDEAAGNARLKYITSAPGQEATYLMKSAQAKEYKSAGFAGDVPPMIAAEASATGLTQEAATEAILMQEAQWALKAAQIEECRRKWKIAMATSTNRAEDLQKALADLRAL